MRSPHHQLVARAFLLLVLAQAAHSVEEYVFRLYDVFAPARFLSGLLNDDRRRGFLILNIGFVVFGLWCYVARVRPGHPWASALIRGWVVVEAANGIAHLAIAGMRGEYFPGVATAPVLLLSGYLAYVTAFKRPAGPG